MISRFRIAPVGDMLTTDVTTAEIKEAKRLRKERDKRGAGQDLTKNRWIGVLGEIIFGEYLDYLGVDAIWYRDNDFHHDFTIGELKIDTKTQTGNWPVKPGYAMNVSERQVRAEPGDYFFMHFEKPRQVLWLCGSIPRWEFIKQAGRAHKGRSFPGNPEATCSLDVRFIQQKALLSPSEWSCSLPSDAFPGLGQF